MILAAARDFDIDLTKSVLVGDKPSDIDAGIAAGVKDNVLFDPGSMESVSLGRINALTQLSHWLTQGQKPPSTSINP